MADLADGRLWNIITWKDDRIARDFLPWALFINAIGHHRDDPDVASPDRIIFLEGTPFSEDFLPVSLITSQQDRKSIMLRTSMGRSGSARAGRLPTAHAPYGISREEDSRPMRDSDQWPVLERLVAWDPEGLSYAEMARRLTAEGVPPPGQKPGKRARPGRTRGTKGWGWTAGAIHRILSSPAVYGEWSFSIMRPGPRGQKM